MQTRTAQRQKTRPAAKPTPRKPPTKAPRQKPGPVAPEQRPPEQRPPENPGLRWLYDQLRWEATLAALHRRAGVENEAEV